MKHVKKKKLLFYIGILAILLLLFLRFGLYYLKSDGFSGLSMLLPMLLLCFLFFAACTAAFFAAWVYQDCKKRKADPVLWVVVVFVATPFIGLLIYGTYIEKEENASMVKEGTHHLKFIAAGIASMVLMLVCLTGFVVSVAAGKGINTNVASSERVWNMGVITMEYSTYLDGVWNLDFKSASNGFVEEQNMTITDADTQLLYADISCGAVPDGATLVLWLVQKDVVKSIDVTNLDKPLEYPLHEFENGKVHVRLQINGVENTVSEISIQ